MKTLFVAAATAIALTLTGCSTSGSSSDTSELSTKEAAKEYLALVCPVNFAVNDTYAALDNQDIASLNTNAAAARDLSQTAAKGAGEIAWPASTTDLFEQLKGDLLNMVAYFNNLATASSIEEAVSYSNPEFSNVSQEIRLELDLPADTDASCAEFATDGATEKTTEPAQPAETMGQKNAVKKAQSYLRNMNFSRAGLIEQLEFEGFSTEDATYGVDKLNTDWNAQAAGKAKSYLDSMSFSRASLIEQLIFEGFTPEEAEYGVTAVGY